MKLRLTSKLTVPPGYFQFTIPQLGSKVYRFPLFSMMCRQFRDIAVANPQFGLPTDLNAIADRLEEENALRVAQIEGYPMDMSVQEPTQQEYDRKQPCFVATGGRYGDLMIILPGIKHLFDTTGIKPVVMCAARFAGLLEGVGYADCWPVYGLNHQNNAHLATSYAKAKANFDTVIVPKWWEIQGVPQPKPKPEPDTWQDRVPPNERDSYMTHQWRSCGWTMQELLDWPLVFDRRDADREQALINKLTTDKPFVLYNFKGISSPFNEGSRIIHALLGRFPDLDFIDLSNVVADRIYDLLGLFDRALCLITIDTATFHLSAASPVPTIHLQRSGHGGSLPRGNSVLRLRYDETLSKIEAIRSTIQSLNENQLHRDGVRQGVLPAPPVETDFVV